MFCFIFYLYSPLGTQSGLSHFEVVGKKKKKILSFLKTFGGALKIKK